MNPQQQTLLNEMKRIGDVSIMLRAELDQTRLTFGEVLDLEEGNVIRLLRPTGENIDVYAENVLIGWGELLMVDGALTIRLADLRDAHLPSLQEEDESQPTAA
jgi:flagellar motor switch protein FliN